MTDNPADATESTADEAPAAEDGRTPSGEEAGADSPADDGSRSPTAGGDAPAGETAETADDDASGREDADADLAARVATHDESLAAEVRDLEERAADLETRLDEREETAADLESRLKRTRADFENYKKRAKKRQDQIRDRATEDLVERLVPVRDNLVRALDQEEGVDIRGGVESTLEEFDRVLEDENVTPIDPQPGDEVDPERHEVMLRVDSDQPAETIADVYQPGYEMAEKVIRPAQVTVSDGADEE